MKAYCRLANEMSDCVDEMLGSCPLSSGDREKLVSTVDSDMKRLCEPQLSDVESTSATVN